jgi:glyoxylase-like metal-dependent hydrolase (beta-lactamase superfamily II)
MERVITYTGRGSNGYIIVGEKTICVDSGNLPDQESFRKVCEDNHIPPETIGLIVITHGHEDHFQNSKEMRDLTGAPILCHEKAATALREGQKPHVLPRNEVGLIAFNHGQQMEKEMAEHPDLMPSPVPIQPVQPDITFSGTYDLKDWGIQGRIIETPGHSEGCTSVILDSGVAFIGDLIVTEPDSQLSTIAMFTYRENNDSEVHASVQAVLDSGVETFYSGHGGPFTRSQVQEMLNKEI